MRALLLVLDSVGIGNAPDAEKYGDAGANTLGHIFDAVPDLELPTLSALGLRELLPNARPPTSPPRGSYGKMRERSAGKDTTTGHWEIAGVVLDEPFAVYERFPDELLRSVSREADVEFLGNYARSGTAILDELGEQHMHTGCPIVYTSADSVFQIAAHEEVIPIERLYEICRIARRHCDPLRIGRVIARPFVGGPGNFRRTPNRHDFSMRPPRTVLDAIGERVPVIGVGKISDIFAGDGITRSHPTISNEDGMRRVAQLWAGPGEQLIFANLVDFDMLYGHRRDAAGYATALREFDAWFAEFERKITAEDLVIITADHGNDPTFRGTDHTREEVPLFVLHEDATRQLGTRATYADIAASLAEFFKLPEPWPVGCSFLS